MIKMIPKQLFEYVDAALLSNHEQYICPRLSIMVTISAILNVSMISAL